MATTEMTDAELVAKLMPPGKPVPGVVRGVIPCALIGPPTGATLTCGGCGANNKRQVPEYGCAKHITCSGNEPARPKDGKTPVAYCNRCPDYAASRELTAEDVVKVKAALAAAEGKRAKDPGVRLAAVEAELAALRKSHDEMIALLRERL